MTPRLKKLLLLQPSGGWLPTGFTELEYLESPSTADMHVAAYFALPINNKPGRDTLRIVSEHYVPSIPSVVSMEGIGLNLCTFHTLCYSVNSKQFFFSYDGAEPTPLADINLYYSFPVGEWATYETFRGAEEVSFSVNGSIVVHNTVEWSAGALENKVIGCFGRISGDSTYTAYGQYGRKKSWKLYHNGALLYDLRPVLDAEGTPCMFDRVSRTCFYNQGVGTFGYRVLHQETEVAPMSLRDPYYTAPQRPEPTVKARRTDVGVEIVPAEQPVEGEEWVYFSSTQDAELYFREETEEFLTNP